MTHPTTTDQPSGPDGAAEIERDFAADLDALAEEIVARVKAGASPSRASLAVIEAHPDIDPEHVVAALELAGQRLEAEVAELRAYAVGRQARPGGGCTPASRETRP